MVHIHFCFDLGVIYMLTILVYNQLDLKLFVRVCVFYICLLLCIVYLILRYG